jgi:hypothetical protein
MNRRGTQSPAQWYWPGAGFTFYGLSRWRDFILSQTMALTAVLADQFYDMGRFGCRLSRRFGKRN